MCVRGYVHTSSSKYLFSVGPSIFFCQALVYGFGNMWTQTETN